MTCLLNYHTNTDLTKCLTDVLNCNTHIDNACSVCQTNYSLERTLNICYSNILNCATTQYHTINKRTYCATCNTGYTLTVDSLCQLTDANCAQYVIDLSKCQKCMNGYQLASDNLCSGCPVANCLNCQASDLFGYLCTSCQSGFTLGPNRQSCIAACQVSDSIANCTNCAASKCSGCAPGYYVNESNGCSLCNSKFANCDLCAINVCTQCSLGYYYDSTKLYCYKCTSSMDGCQICADKNACQKCQSNGFVLADRKCLTCSSQIQNCSTCTLKAGEVKCDSCIDGYVQQFENQISYCLSCSDFFKLPYCLTCSRNPNVCTKCVNGFYLSEGNCLSCPTGCTGCLSNTICTACNSQLILQDTQCTSNVNSVQLTPATTTDVVLAYANIMFTQYSLGTYHTMGTLNQKGYFCQSDKQCNMNGRCLTISCNCIADIFGSRCQYSRKQDFSSLQSNLLVYLQTPRPVDDNQISILQLISDSSAQISDANIQRIISTLGYLIDQQYDVRYYNIIGALAKNIYPQETVAAQKLANLDNLLIATAVAQAKTMLISETQTSAGPYHKQSLSKFDLKDPDSIRQFRSQFVRTGDEACDNEKRFLTPYIYFTEDLTTKLQSLQGNASTPLLINQMHLYFNLYRGSGQQINSTISRMQFLKNGTNMDVDGISSIVLVPKSDQTFSDINEQHICVYWDKDKQIWQSLGTATLRCRYYTICKTTHFSDFATYINITTIKVNPRPTLSSYLETDFEILLAVQNGAFALSMSLIGLFIVWTILIVVINKVAANKPKRRPNARSNTYENVMQSGIGIGLESQPDTERVMNRSLRREIKNMWMVYPLHAIFKTDSIDYQLQKMSLYILQLQVYVTFTSIFLAIEPFSFGRLTGYYIVAIALSWITNYIFGGLAVAFRKKSKKSVFGCYWVIFVLIFFGLVFIGIWRMYGMRLKFDFYLVAGFGIEFVLDSVLCDLFVTYVYQSLFIDTQPGGVWKIVKFRGYFD